MKKCIKCKVLKPLEDFNKKSCRKDGLDSICRECMHLLGQQHYQNNKEQYRNRKLKNKSIKRNFLKDIKKDLKCSQCPENHPATLDFHHKDPKEKDHGISQMLDYSKEKILEEMQKCIILCSNCHRKLHSIIGG